MFKRKKPNTKIIKSFDYAVGKLTLNPGDIVVLSTDLLLDKDQCTALRDRGQEHFPDHKVVVLSAGIKLGVIRAEDQDG
jgi:serine phosphatase RsbU (regulator of sigma subunit)